MSSGQQHNFNKYNAQFVTAFQQAYDYGSIMHYDKFDFATVKDVWTIRPSYPGYLSSRIGQRNGLSANDVKKLNLMYPAPWIYKYPRAMIGAVMNLVK